jgi:two-component system NtrC family response regulator
VEPKAPSPSEDYLVLPRRFQAFLGVALDQPIIESGLARLGLIHIPEEKEIKPLGDTKSIQVDVRVIASTNRNLEDMVETGQFREDLLFRLKTFVIQLPALREHREDIRELAIHHVARLCQYYATDSKGFSPEFFSALEGYHWPGNVRELFNTLERTVAMARHEPVLYPYHLPNHLRALIARAAVRGTSTAATTEDVDSMVAPIFPVEPHPPASEPAPADTQRNAFPTMHDYRSTMDRRYLEDLMRITKGDIRTACGIAQLSRSSLYGLLKKHDIPYRG